jgi:drug/metabolite transporter (DMT)-like permease
MNDVDFKLVPVQMIVGFTHASGVAGALLLNLEAPFTMVLAVALFGESVGARALVGALLVIAGAAILSASPGAVSADGLGVAALAGACLAWAVDNNLAARLALRDPIAVARWKTAGAGTLGALLSLGLGMRFPSARIAGMALVVGFVGYGLSIVLAVKAMRLLGAARQAAFFAIAPFVGAVAAVPLLGESLGPRALAAAVAMSAGLVLLWREEHAHAHTHEALAHDHVHVHDDHHRHVHDDARTGSEPHAHPHVHAPLTHSHPHAPDAHHRHRH